MQALYIPLLLANLLSCIPWTAVFLLTQHYGVRLYYIKRREEAERIQKRLQGRCSHTTDGGRGFGYSIGYWYIASISGESSESSIYLIATEASYKALTRDADEPMIEFDEEVEEITPRRKIYIHERTGIYECAWWRRRERDAYDIPTEEQAALIAKIKANQKKHRHTVVLLHGPPCTGKSMMGVLLANEYGGNLCETLKPWQPGDSIGQLHAEVEPTPEKPLIIVFNEIDAALMKIHEGIPPHEKIPIAVADKTGWNGMLDNIDRRMYQDVILIMTSNRDPEFIDALDPSYIREGRVDFIVEMKEKFKRVKN
jgi:SpoVK/Ycf46/Vps4 family AAA+-type ATPase